MTIAIVILFCLLFWWGTSASQAEKGRPQFTLTGWIAHILSLPLLAILTKDAIHWGCGYDPQVMTLQFGAFVVWGFSLVFFVLRHETTKWNSMLVLSYIYQGIIFPIGLWAYLKWVFKFAVTLS